MHGSLGYKSICTPWYVPRLPKYLGNGYIRCLWIPLSPVYTIQPVVKPVVQLSNRFDNRVKCLYTRYNRLSNPLSNRLYNAVWQPVERTAVRSTRLSNRLSNPFDNRYDNWLYRVNGVLESMYVHSGWFVGCIVWRQRWNHQPRVSASVSSCATHQAAAAGLHDPHSAVDLRSVVQGSSTSLCRLV